MIDNLFSRFTLLASSVLLTAFAAIPTIDAQDQTENQENAPISEENRQARLAERDQFWEQALKFDRALNYSDAIAFANKALALEVELFGKFSTETADTIKWIAECREFEGDFERAIKAWKMVTQIRSKIHDEDHWLVIDARLSLQQAQLLDGFDADQFATFQRARKLNFEVLRLKRESKFAEAIPLAEEVLKLYRLVTPEGSRHEALALKHLAMLYQAMGKYDLALPLAEKSVELRAALYGQNHPRYADAVEELALLQMARDEYYQALPLLVQVRDIRARLLGKETHDYVASLGNLSMVFRQLAMFEEADTAFKESRDIGKRIYGPDTFAFAKLTNSYAFFLTLEGQLEEAETLYLQSLETKIATVGRNHESYATGLNNLAYLYTNKGDYSRAVSLYHQCIEVYQQVYGDDHPKVAMALSNLGQLYKVMSDDAEAELYFSEAQQMLKRLNLSGQLDYASLLRVIAEFYRLRNDNEKAITLVQEALAIYEKYYGVEHPIYVQGIVHLGYMNMVSRNLVEAEKLFEQAMAIRKREYGDRYARGLQLFQNLYVLYMVTGRFEQAETVLQESIERSRKDSGEQSDYHGARISNLGFLYKIMGREEEAADLSFEAIELGERSVGSSAASQSERTQLVASKELRYRLDLMLSIAVDSGRFNERAYDKVLSWKGATLVRQRQIRIAAEQPEAAAVLTKLQRATSRLATASNMKPVSNQVEHWKKRVISLRREKELLETELNSLVSNVAKLENLGNLATPVSLKSLLPANSAIIDFLEYRRVDPGGEKGLRNFKYNRNLLAFVIRPGRPVEMINLGEVEQINEHIDQWRRGFGMTADSADAGQQLRKLMWEPIEERLDGCELLLISPDGALGRMPFAALPGSEPGTYLIEQYRLATIPVSQLLPSMLNANQTTEYDGLLVMGNVDFDADPQQGANKDSHASVATDERLATMNGMTSQQISTRGVRGKVRFADLPATADEIANIRRLYGQLIKASEQQVHVLQQNQATEQKFFIESTTANYLHLATHGFFADPSRKSALTDESSIAEQPSDADALDSIMGFNPGLLSGLAFTGANRRPEFDRDDGILTSAEIASLRLNHVQLIVMSACETGLGKVAGGEGLIGIQRAFQIAGAKSTIASFWNVEDRATMVLMTRFYTNLWEKKMSKLDALREAQIWMLDNPDKIWDEETYAALRGDARRRPVIEQSKNGQNKQQRLSPEFWAAFSLSGDWR